MRGRIEAEAFERDGAIAFNRKLEVHGPSGANLRL